MGKPRKPTGGALIASRLSELGKSQTWLAEEVGVPDGTVSRWVSEGREPTLSLAVRIADALDVDVRDLVVSTKRTGTEG